MVPVKKPEMPRFNKNADLTESIESDSLTTAQLEPRENRTKENTLYPLTLETQSSAMISESVAANFQMISNNDKQTSITSLIHQ